MTAIGRILPLLAPWNAPVYVTRAWCLFELFTAIRNWRDVEIDILLPPGQRVDFLGAMTMGNYTVLEHALDGIRAEDATATEAADLAAIHGYVAGIPGGVTMLNETVRGRLRGWFEGQGAIMSSARVHALRRASVISGPEQPRSSTGSMSAETHAAVGATQSALDGPGATDRGITFNPVFDPETRVFTMRSSSNGEYEDDEEHVLLIV